MSSSVSVSGLGVLGPGLKTYYVYMSVRMYVCMYVHLRMHVCMYVCTYVCMLGICVYCIHAYIHTYIHTYMHAYIHANFREVPELPEEIVASVFGLYEFRVQALW